jgi:hypothetical protein
MKSLSFDERQAPSFDSALAGRLLQNAASGIAAKFLHVVAHGRGSSFNEHPQARPFEKRR